MSGELRYRTSEMGRNVEENGADGYQSWYGLG